MKQNMFPECHLAKYASIPALYEEAMNQNVPPSKFSDFIYSELSNNAQLWVSIKELN